MVNVLAVAAGLLMGLCKMWKPHIMVISGRAVMGFYCGTLTNILQSSINTHIMKSQCLRVLCKQTALGFLNEQEFLNCTWTLNNSLFILSYL